ncbi:hypothetical protein [Bacillus cereus]
MDANKIIDALGGTSVVAEMCNLTTGAVSQWRTSENGIPKSWVKYFTAIRPDLFEKSQADLRAA